MSNNNKNKALYTNLYRPENAHELFNLRHASLRNAIERIFGVVKRKFKILGQVAEYSIDTQVDLVLAITGLYNFIRQHEDIEEELIISEADLESEEDITQELSSSEIRGTGSVYMNKKREAIATAMWEDYQQYLLEDTNN